MKEEKDKILDKLEDLFEKYDLNITITSDCEGCISFEITAAGAVLINHELVGTHVDISKDTFSTEMTE